MGGRDDGVTTGPDGQRSVCDGENKSQAGTDQATPNPEERSARDSSVGAGARPDRSYRTHDGAAENKACEARRERAPEVETQCDGQPTEDDDGPGQVGTDEDG
jgi:hypothetical protein